MIIPSLCGVSDRASMLLALTGDKAFSPSTRHVSDVCWLLEAELKSHSAWRTDDETPPTTNGPSQSGIQQISRTALSTTHATPTIRKSPRCDMENNKTLPLDSHSQTPKLLAKPREKQQQKHKTKRNKNKRNRTTSIALMNKTCLLANTRNA